VTSREYSFTRYLTAKKSVDDRALNHHVWQVLKDSMPKSTIKKPLKVLEIGAGIGTMIERLIEWDFLEYAEYTAIDSQADNIDFAQEYLSNWANKKNYHVVELGNELIISSETKNIKVKLIPVDLFAFIASMRGKRTWDLIIAHAFLDLVDIPDTLPQIFALTQEGSKFYFSINYDGLTVLEPAIDHDFDRLVLELYHRTMEQRQKDGLLFGDRNTGRHLFHHIRRSGGQILASGSSDWVVYPEVNSYQQDEAYFLHFIIHTIFQALVGHPDLDSMRFAEWIRQRHFQIERKELIYIAHQIDFFGLCPPNIAIS
jgi:SAM-dependent methyltransferase